MFLTVEGQFEVQFLPGSQEVFNDNNFHQGPYVAVESEAYYEAYVHVLTGLQNIARSQDPFPMEKYIVRLDYQAISP